MSWHHELGVFDLETTGVDVETARVVTAHIGLLDEHGEIVHGRSWLLDPGVEIPAEASAVHGISTELAREKGMDAARGIAGIVDQLRRLFARSVPVVAYNAPYDFSLLDREARRHGIEPLHSPGPIIDPLVIDRAVDKFRPGKRTLTVTADHYGIVLTDAHDAGADAIAAGRLAQALARRHTEHLAIDAAELHRRQIGWCREQVADFQEYMRRVRDPEFTASGDWPLL
ncbi:DNA polymerase III subunit epsilon [Leifsonia xyli subsp. xyli]|uniref:DNA polymerase III, epsilon subunit n=2 Tax=Leifsonia xyli subsp. xyli TaxID=59736 RepID=Q6AF17_LEIXX|nr:3'-5' exonuclease [Leifsonia xyli]AAT89028.1 DNA polymerase III, epsilon subunit [Leifsonia xyli subsp. xyli str. CTCB07]ODA90507.1 DNA polymerase III subunit epsilon [Leifsonia xyli subsp. xyli]